MKYITTRSSTNTFTLQEAAFAGLAPDGGLFVPATVPQVSIDVVREFASSASRPDGSFAEMTEYLAGLFFANDLSANELREACRTAFDFEVPLKKVGSGLDDGPLGDLFTLELFHGPTCAFKDFGARFMGQTLAKLRPSGENLTILTATSGDTGSAVAAGFHGAEGIDVVVLYPKGKVSDLQESQMTTLGGNVHALRVDGSFDDCQRMVKEVFADTQFRAGHNVTSANSINVLRWIPQSFYYFWGVAKWLRQTGRTPEDGPTIIVPSGNYGNLSAGMLARAMGLPIKRLVAAANANDVVPEWLRTGDYRPRGSVRTVANAMDVGAPSNYERMTFLTGGNLSVLRSQVAGFSSSDEEIRAGIREMWELHGYLSDPHSAVGYNAVKALTANGSVRGSEECFWLSTAAAAKFGEVIEPTLGFAPEIPGRLAKLQSRPKNFIPIAPDANQVREFIANR